jgi:hypothetical protein
VGVVGVEVGNQDKVRSRRMRGRNRTSDATSTPRSGSPLRICRSAGPGSFPGLCAHDGIGFIAGINSSGVPWAIGAKGRIRLDTAEAIGEDPLQPHRVHAARMLRRASS